MLVEARGLHKHYGALHVLKGVDLVVAERELVFIIGPSGSGKSTLLRCLNRLEVPSSGSVRVDGIDLLDPRTDINHARQRIGMVFQSFNLYPHMTAPGNVTLALRKVAGKSRAEADELGRAALARDGLADRAGHRPGEFVVNLADEGTANAMHLSASEPSETESEFAKYGLTAVPAKLVQHPRIGEAGASLECRLERRIEFGPERAARWDGSLPTATARRASGSICRESCPPAKRHSRSGLQVADEELHDLLARFRRILRARRHVDLRAATA